MVTRREKIFYFSLALVLFMVIFSVLCLAFPGSR
jgi:cell division protein FtsL